MDNSRKPDRKNPRQGINPISNLLFLWMLPMLYKGYKNGLNTDDLTQCMGKDRSHELTDRLDRNWKNEIENAAKRKKTPKLQNALFKTFYANTIFDGILCFLFVFFRSILPVVLAQLLLQFQEAITKSPPSINSIATNATEDDYENVSMLNQTIKQNDLSTSTNNTAESSSFIENDTVEKHSLFNSTYLGDWEYYMNDAYFLSSILCLLALCGVLCDHHSQMRLRMLGARMRVGCCSLIYRKTLVLSKKTTNHTSTGYLINLISNDVGRFDFGFAFMHYLWITPIQVCIVLYILWTRIGYAALVGVFGLLLMTTPVQIVLSHLSAYLRRKVAERTDHRVGIMNEIIQGIQVIKMYAWELPFVKIVAKARKEEVKEIRRASYIRGVHLSIMVFIERTALFMTLLSCVLLNQNITADIVFSLAQFFNVLQLTTAIFCALALLLGSEALMSIKRVEEFLLLNEREDSQIKIIRPDKNGLSGSTIGLESVISLKGLNAYWDESQRKTLDDINLTVKPGQLCAVIGPVGAGKSSLLHLLLGELPIHSGISMVNGTISYASQEPWLFSENVRANILFGEEFNRDRYNEVVHCCALRADFEQLPKGDKSHVGENGSSLSGGQKARVSLARAVYKKSSIYLLDDPLSAVDAHVGKHLFDEVIGPKGCLAKDKSTRILVTHQVHFLHEADIIVIVENGKISKQGTYDELSKSNLDFAKLLKQNDDAKDWDDDLMEEGDDSFSEDDIPYIDGVKPKYQKLRSRSLSKSLSSKSASNLNIDVLEAEEQASGSVAIRIWKKYFSAGSSKCGLIAFALLLILSQVVTSGSDYFVNYWTQEEYLRIIGTMTEFTTNQCLYIYGALIVGVIALTLIRSYTFVIVCMNASKKLHNKMFAALLAAPMRFFDTNPTGRVLNRFSKDMGIIDEILPRVMMEAVQILLVMSGIFCMVCLINPLMIVTLAIGVFLFSLLMILCLRPSQDMKRLEGICRSPVFSYMTGTFLGIATIRSRGLEQKLAMEFDELQDVHTGIFHLSVAGMTTFGLWLDLISTSFVTVLTFSFIAMRDDVPSGNVGLAISQSLILTGMVQYGIRQMTETLLQMTSVERVIQYTDLEEEPNPSKRPPLPWPERGHIQMHGMSLKYDLNAPAILKNIEIDIQPTWKVGVVGRTGAGKSSFINALFRLTTIEGEILIDGLDTGTISLESLRSNISIIPQEPVLFTDTIRNNLDPFHLYSDDEVWRSLEAVELKLAIDSLDYMVTESGSNFSVGQRQLLCLARAILRNNRILVLDEATANVDPQTDFLIQKTIRTKFNECTVLTIAHRLHTVIDSDRILVMDAGRAIEFDQPHILLHKRNGMLRSMVEALGSEESDQLKRIARTIYEKNKEQ